MARHLLVFVLSTVIASVAWSAEPQKVSPAAALTLLKEGNARFAAGKSTHPDQSVERRVEVAKGQRPYAIIVACADSRLSPEVIFDLGLGDVFVIRVAGNIIDDHSLGSIEYAVEHLGTSLIVVLGHQRCGAVAAALAGGEAPGHIKSLVTAIQPAVQKVKADAGDALENAVKENAREVADAIRSSEPILKPATEQKSLVVVSGYYDLDDGKVTFLK